MDKGRYEEAENLCEMVIKQSRRRQEQDLPARTHGCYTTHTPPPPPPPSTSSTSAHDRRVVGELKGLILAHLGDYDSSYQYFIEWVQAGALSLLALKALLQCLVAGQCMRAIPYVFTLNSAVRTLATDADINLKFHIKRSLFSLIADVLNLVLHRHRDSIVWYERALAMDSGCVGVTRRYFDLLLDDRLTDDSSDSVVRHIMGTVSLPQQYSLGADIFELFLHTLSVQLHRPDLVAEYCEANLARNRHCSFVAPAALCLLKLNGDAGQATALFNLTKHTFRDLRRSSEVAPKLSFAAMFAFDLNSTRIARWMLREIDTTDPTVSKIACMLMRYIDGEAVPLCKLAKLLHHHGDGGMLTSAVVRFILSRNGVADE